MADLDATPGSQDRAAESAQQATRAEETICRIWAELLFADEVRTTDNFFDLGGDSFLAIRLSHRIQEELGIEVLLHELLASPTVAGQAAAISAAGCNGIKPRS